MVVGLPLSRPHNPCLDPCTPRSQLMLRHTTELTALPGAIQRVSRERLEGVLTAPKRPLSVVAVEDLWSRRVLHPMARALRPHRGCRLSCRRADALKKASGPTICINPILTLSA